MTNPTHAGDKPKVGLNHETSGITPSLFWSSHIDSQPEPQSFPYQIRGHSVCEYLQANLWRAYSAVSLYQSDLSFSVLLFAVKSRTFVRDSAFGGGVAAVIAIEAANRVAAPVVDDAPKNLSEFGGLKIGDCVSAVLLP